MAFRSWSEKLYWLKSGATREKRAMTSSTYMLTMASRFCFSRRQASRQKEREGREMVSALVTAGAGAKRSGVTCTPIYARPPFTSRIRGSMTP